MIDEVLVHCEASVAELGHIVFTPEQLEELTENDVTAIQERFMSRILMQLPQHEIEFFEWLKLADPAVWEDLWLGEAVPYLVSLAFLPGFLGPNNRGRFVICDLVDNENFFFSPDMLLEKESTDFIAAVQQRFHAGHKLSLEQSLALEASLDAIDIWHFARKYKVDIALAKQAAMLLVEDRILVHVPKADHLSDHFEVN